MCWGRNETESEWRTGPWPEVTILFPLLEFADSRLQSGLCKVHHPVLPPHKVVFKLLDGWYLKIRHRGHAGTRAAKDMVGGLTVQKSEVER